MLVKGLETRRNAESAGVSFQKNLRAKVRGGLNDA